MQIADHGVLGLADHVRLAVGVDREDVLGGHHPDPVLDRARDAAGDVQLGCNPLTGLADLITVRTPAVVGDDTRAADSTAEQFGEFDERGESLSRTDAATATDDDSGRRQRDARRQGDAIGDAGARRVLGQVGNDYFDCGDGVDIVGRGLAAEDVRDAGQHVDGSDQLRLLEQAAAPTSAGEVETGIAGVLDLGDIGREREIGDGCGVGEDLVAAVGTGGDDCGRGASRDELGDGLAPCLWCVVGELGVVNLDDLRHAVRAEICDEAVGFATDEDRRHRRTDTRGEQRPCAADRLVRGLHRFAAIMFDDDQDLVHSRPNLSIRSTMAGAACSPLPSIVVWTTSSAALSKFSVTRPPRTGSAVCTATSAFLLLNRPGKVG